MFTGLIEEMGTIKNISKGDIGFTISIRGDKVLKNTKIGDSIAVNGVCLTVTKYEKSVFSADVMFETINRSGLKRVKKGENVNLEKSLTMTTFLGGHLVLGDVDCEVKIKSITQKGIAKVYEFQLDKENSKYMKYIVEKGRVTLDGASLTVVNVNDDEAIFSVSLIPHTQEVITLGKKKVGDFVNLETDLMGKYVEKILKFNENSKKENKSKITLDFLAKNGF